MFDYDEIEDCIEKNEAAAAANNVKKFEEEAAKAPVGKSTEEVVARGLKAMVRRRAPGLPKAPIAVVIMPGNPELQGFNAHLPLPTAVDDALGDAGFPIVRYDWSGVGMNKDSRGGATTQDDDINFEDSCVFLNLAQELGERVCIISWNYSGKIAGFIATPKHRFYRPEVCALISLSFGYKQWEFEARFGGQKSGYACRRALENHANILVPTIYIFGSKDNHTPVEDVQRIINGRKDRGEEAKMHIVDQSDQKLHPPEYFAMHDKEKEVAITCVEWLKGVYAKRRASELTFSGPRLLGSQDNFDFKVLRKSLNATIQAQN